MLSQFNQLIVGLLFLPLSMLVVKPAHRPRGFGYPRVGPFSVLLDSLPAFLLPYNVLLPKQLYPAGGTGLQQRLEMPTVVLAGRPMQ